MAAGLAACALAACSSPQSSSSSSTGDAGNPIVDAGPDAASTACDAPDASPTLACGTLVFAKSPVASRPRNHHVTLLVPVTAASAGSPSTMLYAIGGANTQATTLAFVDRAPLNADGSLGAWASEPPLPVASGGLVGGLVSGVIVVAGGTVASSFTSTVTDKAYSAVVQPDGSLAAWKPAGTVVQPRMHAGSFVKGDTMWILGGFNDQTVWSDIVSATVQPDGTVSTWAPAGQLPGPRSHFSVELLDDYVYIVGGLAASALDDPPELKDVWRGQIQADGTVGGWVQMMDLPVDEATHASFFYGGYLHVCGGINDTTQEDRCWRSPVGADHALGAFEEVASLPIARGHVHQMPVLGANVYSVAGATDFNLDSTTEIDIGTFQMGSVKPKITPRLPPDPTVEPHKGPKCHIGR